MNFKNILFFIPLLAFYFDMISCNNSSSGTGDNQKNLIKSKKPDSAKLYSTFPKGAKRLDSLPKGLKGFVEKNYSGYTIWSAVSDPLCGGNDAIDVSIAKLNAPDLSLIFRPDGTFLQQEQKVPLSITPCKIQEILKTKYAGYSPENQIEKLTLADKSVQYRVGLLEENGSKEVIFSGDCKLICESQ